MLKVKIDTSPLVMGHSIRGIGSYTKNLVESLGAENNVELVTAGPPHTHSADLIHYPYFDFFFDTLPIKPFQKTVITIHDAIPLLFPEYYRPGLKGKIRLYKQLISLKFVSAIITDSNSSRLDINEYMGVPLKKIHVIPLAANPAYYHRSEKEIASVKRRYKLPKNYILYVGDINYNKNIPQLIKAVKYLPGNVKLVCVGKNFKEQDIPEWSWIETQLALSDVRDKVKFVTNVEGNAVDDLASIYSGAQCYIHPSLYEGFGLPLLEALSCQTLVVSTLNSSIREVVGEHAIFVGTEAEKIASGIMTALDMTQTEKKRRLKEGLEWAKNFSWSKVAAQTIRVYQQVIGHS